MTDYKNQKPDWKASITDKKEMDIDEFDEFFYSSESYSGSNKEIVDKVFTEATRNTKGVGETTTLSQITQAAVIKESLEADKKDFYNQKPDWKASIGDGRASEKKEAILANKAAYQKNGQPKEFAQKAAAIKAVTAKNGR